MKNLNTLSIDKTEKFWKYGVFGLWMALLAHAMFSVFFYIYGVYEMAVFNIFSILAFAICIYLAKVKKYGNILNISYIEVTLHTVLATYFVGINSGFYYYLFVLVIVSLIVKQKSINAHIVKSLLYVGMFFVLELVFLNALPVYVIDSETLFTIRVLNLFGLLLFSVPF
ncbi:MAG: hypothetical protein OQK11_07655, partial [Thiovulaceae bacterium]|nr:hypothetical protein [Sulfurimonadaceae bacterium]